MKIISFRSTIKSDRYRVGVIVSDSEILDVTSVMGKEDLHEMDVLEFFDLDNPFRHLAEEMIGNPEPSHKVGRSDIKVMAPIPCPGKIICIGLNYRDHAEESGMAIPKSPVIFSKFSTCVIGPGEPIVVPDGSEQLDYEAELAFVIGRRSKNVARADALGNVFGYVNFNDVSARDFQFADGQWQRGKSCDTFAPMGEYLVTADEIPDPQDLSIKLRLNGETMQDSSTAQMIFGVAELIEFLSRFITLEPGDIVATGTPPGVGFARKPPVYMKDGDVVEVEIEGLGVLSNPVRAAK